METEFSYDVIPYPSYTFSQTHPERMATIASCYGLESELPEKCRVLELGCGDGTNLLWCASTLPESEFVGVDLSKLHINDAISGISELGLSNISFHQQDLMEFSREKFGEFDYIVAHGLFSWVPDFVREKVLQIYSECLAPNGVGYISYNAFPGCHIRQMIGDIMRFHVDGFSDSLEKVRQSRAIIKFISDTAEKDSLYQKVIKAELEIIEDRADSGIFHDDLSEVNDPFYFMEFIGKIRPYGLQYLCEAKSSSKHTANMTPEVASALDSLGDDIIRREQYLDMITGRRFRSTLICRETIMVNHVQKPDLIDSYFIASRLSPVAENVNIQSLDGERFTTKDDSAVETNHPFTKAALIRLNELGNEEISFTDLTNDCIDLGGNTDKRNLDADIARTAGFLIEMFKAGYVDLRRRKALFASEAGEFPVASPFVRWQVSRKSDVVRTLTGNNIKPEGNYVLELIALLDGTRNRDALASEMANLFERDGAKREDFEKDLPESLNKVLSQLAEAGLLVK